ncbi:MAG: nucleotide pyrophosphohydrolase [Gammaproteobacteria bacterium]|nr:nucleotide pyrophosphohydrolase [Gammaproteobacteria bacterium]
MLSPDTQRLLLNFRAERDWEQFHNLRTLSVSIVLESAELLELSQWTPDTELPSVVVQKMEQIKHEVADIAILMSYLTNDLGIDLDAAVRSKLLINGKKYPVEKAKGSSKKYDELR